MKTKSESQYYVWLNVTTKSGSQLSEILLVIDEPMLSEFTERANVTPYNVWLSLLTSPFKSHYIRNCYKANLSVQRISDGHRVYRKGWRRI